MKALILVTDTSRGGAPGRCAAIALGMRRFGWQSLVVSLKPGGPALRDLERQGVPVDSLNLTRAAGLPFAAAGLRALVRRWQPDVIQASLWHANVLARIGLIGLPVPVVCTFEGIDAAKPWVRVLIDRNIQSRAVANVAVSRAVGDAAIARDGIRADTLRIIPSGLDMDHWARSGRRRATRGQWALGDGARVVGWTGRMAREKDLATLVRALPLLPDWRLALAGDGAMRPALYALARQLGVDARVIDMGELADVRPFLEGLDVFALSSREEGLPLALLEAMAMEVPVAATAVGGIPEIVRDGQNGRLVPPGDPAALAEAIQEAGRTPSFGRHGRETIRTQCGIADMLGAYDALWRSICGPQAAREPATTAMQRGRAESGPGP